MRCEALNWQSVLGSEFQAFTQFLQFVDLDFVNLGMYFHNHNFSFIEFIFNKINIFKVMQVLT